MFIQIDDGVYINSDMVTAVELSVVSSEPYGEIFRWAFYTNAGEKSVFFSKDFDSREEAENWFENIRFMINKG